jgi:F0F1-type ATP synthase delta subunit
MKAPRTRIAKTIADRTLKDGVSKTFSKEIAAYLLSEGRVSELDSVLRDVRADWADDGYVEVLASSAHPLTAETKTEIMKQAKSQFPAAKKIVISEINDPDVIGGVRLSLANQQLDLTVESKLNKFKQLTAGKD